jgi:hypothetical protein
MTEDFSITLDPGAEHTPGTVLSGILRFMTNSSETQVDIPVQMTVAAPSDWGSVKGLVVEKDRCDQASDPSIGAQVNLYSDAGRTHLAGSQLSDEDGKYSISLPKGGYFLSVVKNGYVSGSDLPVQIDSAQATSQDAALRLDAPCVTSKSASLDDVLLKDKATSLELELENSGAGSGSYDLTQVEPAADWLTLTPKSGSISAGGDARVAVTFDSTGMLSGDYSTGLDLQVDGAPVIHIPVTLKVQTYSLTLTGGKHLNNLPGTEVAYILSIKDTGSQAGNYEVDVDAGNWSADASVTSISLAAGEAGDLTIHVQIPPGAAWGDTDDTLVTVRSIEDARESAKITLTTTAGAPPDWGTLNGTVSGILRCGTNATPLEGVRIEITKTDDTAPYTTRLTGVDGKFSSQLPPGDYKLVATKDHFTSSAPLPFNISGPAVPTTQDVTIDSNQSCITADLTSLDRTMLNNDTTGVTIRLSNLGPAAGSIAVSKTGGENDWLTYSPVSGTVLPGGHTDLLVDFDTTGLAGGNYSSDLLISLPNQPDGITIPVTLRVDSYGLTLLPALDTRKAAPGSTVAYFLEATNTGNQSETFDVTIEGGSWSVDAPNTIQIDTGETGFFTIWVNIPVGAPLGSSEQITVIMTSRSDPRVSKQSVFATTAVEDKQVKVFIPLVVN